MSDYSDYFNTYEVTYLENNEKQTASVVAKNKEQAKMLASMSYPNVLDVLPIGKEKHFSKKEVETHHDSKKKHDELPSGIYNALKVFVITGFDENGKFFEKKVKGRKKEYIEYMIQIQHPEWKNVQVVEAEDFETI